jgi:signal peptidase II
VLLSNATDILAQRVSAYPKARGRLAIELWGANDQYRAVWYPHLRFNAEPAASLGTCSQEHCFPVSQKRPTRWVACASDQRFHQEPENEDSEAQCSEQPTMMRAAGDRDHMILGLGQQVRTAPFVALVAVEIDQITKLAVRENLPTGDSIPLAASLRLTNVVNPNIAFGIPIAPALSLLLPLVMIVGCLVLYWRFERSNSALLSVGVGLFIGGSLGNVMDRIAYGHVTDFIELISSGGYARTVFNVADACIILGILFIETFLITLLLKRREEQVQRGLRGSEGVE